MGSELKLGIHYEWISNFKYHSGPGWSTTNIKRLREKSPGHMLYAKEHPTEPTDAMAAGQAYHTLTLEPHLFDRRFQVLPEGFTRRSNDDKARYADWQRAGKILIKGEKIEDVKAMVMATKNHPAAGAILAAIPGTVYERAIYWQDPKTELICKCRPDIMAEYPGRLLVNDLKKCEDASLSGFRRACGNYYYDVQAAMYLEGACRATGRIRPDMVYTEDNGGEFAAMMMEMASFGFICCEDEAPHGVAVYEADAEMIAVGLEILHWGLGGIADCMRDNHWPLYSGQVQAINLPAWRLA